MTEPINFQVNIMQSQEVPRQSQADKNVLQHQQLAQEANRAQDSQREPETVQTSNDAENAQLDKDGSGRGRLFERRHGGKEKEEEEAEEIQADPTKGTKVDFLR
ncbi:MAG: hypothetical protein AAB229_10130 [Candidatus Hydrogenedentota bacterium]